MGMATAPTSKSFISLALALILCPLATLAAGEIACEGLDRSTCAFAVSSSGMRCVLEKRIRRGREEEEEDYTCRTSMIEAEARKGWIETDGCIQACGLDRSTLGISSDYLVESRFTEKLCSPQCYHGCPNVVDLYFNIAAGEGVYLPKLCEAQRKSARRSMAEIRSSGEVLVASSEKLGSFAPAQSSELKDLGPAMAPAPPL